MSITTSAGSSRMARRHARPPAALLAAGGLAAVIALIPLAYLGVRTAEAGAGQVLNILRRDRTLELVAQSLLLTVIVTAASLVIGITTAILVTRTDLPGRRVLAVLAGLPLAVPSYVAAYTWLTSASWARGLLGASVVLTLVSYPYVYLPVAAAIRRTDPAHEEVARSLGAGPVLALHRVTVPALRPTAASGALLVALYTLSDFGAVSMLGAEVFTRAIFTSYTAGFDRTPAAVLACLLVALTVLITMGERRTRPAVETARVGGGVARAHELLRLGRARWAATAGVGGLLVLALGVPLAGLVRWMAASLNAGVDVAALAAAASATVRYSLAGALVCTLLAIPVGVLAARYRGGSVRLIESATWAGHALPGLVVGLALVFFGIRVVPAWYQQAPLLVFAYVVLFLPAAVGAVRGAVALSSPSLEDVARSLGAGRLRTWQRVTLPLAAPGIATGAALVMLTAAKELPATLLLHPTGVDTLATRLWTYTGIAAHGQAAPYAATLVVLGLMPTGWLLRTSGALGARSRPAGHHRGGGRRE